LFWLGLVWIAAGMVFQGRWGIPSLPSGRDLDDMFTAWTTMAGLHWFVVGLFAVTESDALSRRVRRDLPRSGLLRVLAAPFLPGGSRGLIYVMLHLALLVGFVAVALQFAPPPVSNEFAYAVGLCCYIVIYLGLGSALGRGARKV